MRHTGIGGPTIALVALISMAGGSQAQAAATPKLSGHPSTPVLNQGETLGLEITARAGKAKTAKTKLGLLLSTDKRDSKQDVALKGKANVPALAKRKSKTITKSFALPSKAKPGGYYVLACSGNAKCRALSGTVGVGPRVERVNVLLEPDESRSASALVTRADGGRVEAEAADGTRYALVLPPDAVGGDATVTMTPLTGAQGLPFEGLAAGVKLEPAGLRLDQPARLLIRRDGLEISDATAAFGSSDGSDLFLAPFTTVPEADSLGPGTIGVPITHFSGWGVVSLTETQRAAQYARSSFQADDRITQEMDEAVKEDENGIVERDDLPLEELRDQIVKPLLEAAALDPLWLDQALEAYLSFDRQVALLTGERAIDDPAIEALLAKAFQRYSKALRDRCNSADFTVITAAMKHARRAEFLIPLLGQERAQTIIADALELISQCLHFELRMSSREDFVYPDFYTFGAQASARVPLGYDAGELDGEGPLEYVDASYHLNNPECTSEVTSTQGSTMTVDGFTDLLQLVPPGPGKPAVLAPRLTFRIDPGQPGEHVRHDCSFGTQENDFQHWVDLWAGCAHADPDGVGFLRTIAGFQATGHSGLLATRTFSGSFACTSHPTQDAREYPAQVDETWEFAHTPQIG